MTTRDRGYTAVAIGLHWLIAAAIVVQIILGWRFSDAPKGPAVFALFQLHKSVGITILVLTLARIAWRLGHRPPPAPIGQAQWEQFASRLVHAGFYAILVGLPLTGWIVVSASKLNIPTLLFSVVPWPHLPFIADLSPTAKAAWRTGGEFSHGLLVKITYVLLALHLGAAAKHQVLDRDEVFGHMAPGAGPGWREPRAWVAAAVFAVVVAGAYAYAPIPPATAAAVVAAEPAPPPTSVVTPEASPGALAMTGQSPPAAGPAPSADAPAKPVDWKVQAGSKLGFTATWAGNQVDGAFTGWTARISFSPEALDTSRLEVSVDPAAVSTGDAQRDSSLAGEDFFDSKAHPRATYTATKFRKVGEGRYMALGSLDLRGVKKPLDLPFTLTIKGNVAVATGSVTVNRTDFGVGQGEWAATDQIAAAVRVSFRITAKTAPR